MPAREFVAPRFITLFVLLLVLAFTSLQSAQATGVRYAKPAASGTGDCLSWANACTLQTALIGATSGDEIWVAAGTHKPTTGTDRTATFQLVSGVAVYGGFAATETLRTERNLTTNVTILSGDLNGDDVGFTNNSENVYHVVTGASDATLDGFTITAGYANGGSPNDSGSGMYNASGSAPTLANVSFTGNRAQNWGGGVYNSAGSRPTFTDGAFVGNTAGLSGGGMFNTSSSPALTGVSFSGNSATFNGGGMQNSGSSSPALTNTIFTGNWAQDGGAMYSNFTSNPALTSVSFNGNTATQAGGGMYCDGNARLSNVTFSGNSAGSGGGMFNNVVNVHVGSPTLTNVTFDGNSASYGGGMFNNVNSHPMLTNTTFFSNTATNDGGGMYNSSSTFTLTNVTFSGNSANRGGAIGNLSSHPTVRNTILWSNTVTGTGAQIWDSGGAPAVSDSVVQGGYASGTNIITADPLLGAPGNYGGATQTIPLLAGSSAIDTGNDVVCPATDQRGVTRPQGTQCDIGAYEFEFYSIYLPLALKL